MAKINELLQELCPDGVESVTIGESCEILDSMRKPISKGKRKPGVFPYYGANGIQDWVDDYIFDGDYILIGEDGSVINKDKTPVLNWASGKIWVNNHAHVLKEGSDQILLKYIYYVLKTVDVSGIVRGTPPKINQANLRGITFPFPPLPIQKHIVEVLDTFTDAISNLEEELALREKQFEYYREHLYQFDDECSIKTIKDISVKCFPGATPSTKKPEYWQNGTIPWMSSGEIHQGQVKSIAGRITQLGYDSSSTKMVPINSIVVALAGQGKTRGTVAITRMELCTNQSLCAIIPDQSMVVPEYLYFYLKGQYFNLRQVSAGDGTRGGLTLKHIESYKVPVISLDRQQEIVEILDTFESMIANIKEEIALRTKQYEYYREKLLSFGK